MNGKIAYLKGGKMKFMEHALPEPEPGAMLVRVLSSNICGSDVKNWKGGPLWAWARPKAVRVTSS